MSHDVKQSHKKTGESHRNPTAVEHQRDEVLLDTQSPAAEIQQVSQNPGSLSQGAVLQLQQLIGNQAVGQLLTASKPSPTDEQAVQRIKDEKGNIVGLDMATCELVGIYHEKDKSFATVRSQAWMSSPEHNVVYEIKWDKKVVPGGTHLGQKADTASDWVVDKSAGGEPIGDREGEQAPYFNNETEMKHDAENGTFFWYNDPIQQRRLSGGSWWFRLKVVDGSDTVLSQSHPVEVDWDSV